MPRVLNRRTDEIPPDAVYVGRPSKWGNPFRLGPGLTRGDCIRSYRNYLEECPWLKEDARHELRGRDLVCWCAPLACHADVLLEVANEGESSDADDE